VKTVIIGQLLRRDPRKSPVGYNAEVMRINNHIAQLTATHKDVHFWRHRGFWDSLSYLGRDGVHLMEVTVNGISPAPMVKYLRSIKYAVHNRIMKMKASYFLL
jgi:hypothetical protein